MKYLNRERIIAIICLAFAAYIWIVAGTFPTSFLDSVGPSKYPRFMAGLIGAASLILFFTARGPIAPIKGSREYKAFGFVVITIACYFLLFERIGFILSTTAFLLALTLYFDNREFKTKIRASITYSITFSVFIYFFFAKLLGVLLPGLPI